MKAEIVWCKAGSECFLYLWGFFSSFRNFIFRGKHNERRELVFCLKLSPFTDLRCMSPTSSIVLSHKKRKQQGY